MSPCYEPLQAWFDRKGVSPTGRTPIVFRQGKGKGEQFQIPCGKCIGCLKMKAHEWAIRCKHEMQMHKYSEFVCLTYEKLPKDPEKDFRIFMRNLRKEYGKGIKFFHCLEFGGNGGRPHHHAILFGVRFCDSVKITKTQNYSDELTNYIWCKGYTTTCKASFATAYYIAKYMIKGTDVPMLASSASQINKPKLTMSHRPGLGASWIKKYATDVIDLGACVVQKNQLVKVPRYYDKLIFKENPSIEREVKDDRIKKALKFHRDRIELANIQKVQKLLKQSKGALDA